MEMFCGTWGPAGFVQGRSGSWYPPASGFRPPKAFKIRFSKRILANRLVAEPKYHGNLLWYLGSGWARKRGTIHLAPPLPDQLLTPPRSPHYSFPGRILANRLVADPKYHGNFLWYLGSGWARNGWEWVVVAGSLWVLAAQKRPNSAFPGTY